jgi:hypothetical protein
MPRCQNKTRLELFKKTFLGYRPNTIRVYASRLEHLVERLGRKDILHSGDDILSPWWLADPDLIIKVLHRQDFSRNTMKSYLTAIAAFLNYVSSTCQNEGDRTAAILLVGIYRAKHADMSVF